MKERVGAVIVEAQPALINVLKTCADITHLVPQGKPLPAFAAHCPLMSVPRILQTRQETIPARIPYLSPEPERALRWQKVLRLLPGFRVGICWQGNRSHKGDRQRSLPLRLFAPLAAIPGVTLISLQKGDGSEQIQEVAQQFRVEPLTGLDDFTDTAAVMSGLDLVIACDTASAHLAGRSACLSGSYCRQPAIGAGSGGATILCGTPACGCSDSKSRGIGRRSWNR